MAARLICVVGPKLKSNLYTTTSDIRGANKKILEGREKIFSTKPIAYSDGQGSYYFFFRFQ